MKIEVKYKLIAGISTPETTVIFEGRPNIVDGMRKFLKEYMHTEIRSEEV